MEKQMKIEVQMKSTIRSFRPAGIYGVSTTQQKHGNNGCKVEQKVDGLTSPAICQQDGNEPR